MKGSDIAILLIVLGVGGLAIWFLMRGVAPGVKIAPPASKGLCEAGVEIGAGAASKGQVSAGNQSVAICDLGEKVVSTSLAGVSTVSGGIATVHNFVFGSGTGPQLTTLAKTQAGKGWRGIGMGVKV